MIQLHIYVTLIPTFWQAGDADIKWTSYLNFGVGSFADKTNSCNWLGGQAAVLAMDWYGQETLSQTPFTNMTINGEAVAAVQNVDNFSFA